MRKPTRPLARRIDDRQPAPYQQSSPEPVFCNEHERCQGCPYPRHGIVCWHRGGGCLRTDILILQNDVGNYFSPTVVAAAITSRRDKTHLPTHVLLEDVPGLAPTSLLLLEQIRTVDHRRLRGYIGQISKEKMKEIDAALAISVGLRSLA